METAFAPVVGVIELAPLSTATRHETASVMEPQTLGDHLERLSESRERPSDADGEADWSEFPVRLPLARRRSQRRCSPLPDRFAASLPAGILISGRKAPDRLLMANVVQLEADLRGQWIEIRARLSRAA
jgi:hypothetical protein